VFILKKGLGSVTAVETLYLVKATAIRLNLVLLAKEAL